jgi:hypothetical protein
MPSHSRLHISTIALPTFIDKLKAYDRVRDRVASTKKKASSLSLAELDHERYTVIPETVAGRRLPGGKKSKAGLSNRSASSFKETSYASKKGKAPSNDGLSSYLTKAELTTLMDWKLTHGTFRPTLKGLIAQNDDRTVETVTRDGLALWPDVKESIKKLSELRGVGPATASLILSVAFPEDAPFFSDELFCWATADPEKGEPDWKKKIKYSVAEYLEIVEATKARFPSDGFIVEGNGLGFGEDGRIWAVMCEKVAFVLGNGGWFDDDVDGGRSYDDVGKDEKVEQKGEIADQEGESTEQEGESAGQEGESAGQEESSEEVIEDPTTEIKRERNETSKRGRQDDEEAPTTIKLESSTTRRNPSRAKRPRQ